MNRLNVIVLVAAAAMVLLSFSLRPTSAQDPLTDADRRVFRDSLDNLDKTIVSAMAEGKYEEWDFERRSRLRDLLTIRALLAGDTQIHIHQEVK